jgi:tripartite-type tricarboxylate transporter receptor subunit TctC
LLRNLVAPSDKSLARLFDTIGVLGRSLAMPPAVNDETLATLRSAFTAMLADPNFIDEANRTQLRVLTRTGEELEAAIADAFANSKPDVVQRAQALTQ